ncbi:uncharacterized protein LOC125947648 isoform X2 [Dermacentor silvarum]|uniref:uncharacterized protein LOC125947648 isoform X2 n=1 Tax=Dermacentor silvarum TaxID=543639 RepID=UPI002101A889|nr:uncharacterized protein LOC125947648 isoform X2 [Dermacentor silvarum]
MPSYSRQMNGGDPSCIYINHARFINATCIMYIEGYRQYDKSSQVYPVYARLSKKGSSDSPPVMRATAMGRLKRKYRFEYYDESSKCAVITFSDGKCRTKCELYIWKSSVNGGPSVNCEREYEDSCPESKKYSIYNSDCF